MSTPITVSAFKNAPLEKIWKCWPTPEHITNWNFAAKEWYAPITENH